VTADDGGKVTDKMAHTDDSVEVRAMSVGATLKITPTSMTNASTTISRLLFNLMDGRFTLLVLQFTQVRTPISHPFFANYPFAISRFAFRRLLITVFRGLRNSTPRRGIYVNAAEFHGAAETAPFAPDCRQIALTRVL